EKLRADPAVREMLAEEQRLSAFISQARAESAPPALDWDRLARELSRAVLRVDVPSARLRLTRLHWVGVAFAACVLIVIGIVMRQNPPVAPQSLRIVQVRGPAGEPGAAPAVVEVAIGPGPDTLAGAAGTWAYSDAVVSRPSRVVIAAGGDNPDDFAAPLGLPQ
ncbi:MAG: hypothetical protein ACREJC_11880, partial [Tepidisphaeraceae bacterium]